MLACWDCKNLASFEQVSSRGDRRDVTQASSGLHKAAWSSADTRDAGVYCPSCGKPVEADTEALGLTDDRIEFLSPLDFDADACGQRLRQLRADAEWIELELPAQVASFEPIPSSVGAPVRAALGRTGRANLYSHQSTAIELGLSGRNVVLATPAGSGKSLGLLAPVLDHLARNPSATAIVMFPLKALANDQMAALARLGVVDDPWTSTSTFDLDLGDGAAVITVGRYDGATPDHERKLIRKSARLIVTNPDMLHIGVLPHVRSNGKNDLGWVRIFQNLDYVVLDEIHTYQGAFGSAVSLVLRRLRRIAATFGKHPTFLTASATIGNPVEHARTLTGVADFVLVDNDGSARRRRVVLVCNPPERSSDGGADGEVGRIAPQTVAIDLITDGALAAEGELPIRTIAFVRSRNGVFQLAQRAKGRLSELRRPDLAAAVAPYAATFLAEDRNDAEGRLRDGSTLAIISTNALELGIDIPDLSLAVLVGYPGQISSFRQRAGRAGRLGEGLAVLVVGDDPLQQFLARDPDSLAKLLAGQPEDVVINPFAPSLAERFGLVPAMNDLGGLAFEDAEYFGQELVDAFLAGAAGAPDRALDGRSYWLVATDIEPNTGIRSAVPNESYSVMRQDKRVFTAIGVIDGASAPRDAFVPAVWSGPNGDTYVVTGFDPKKKEIYCEGPRDTGYLTRGIAVDQVELVAEHVPPLAIAGAALGYSALAISRKVVGYREIHHSGVEVNRQLERAWPPAQFDTDGLHLRILDAMLNGHDRDGTMTALEHVLLSVAPAVVACDPNDLEATSHGSTLYLYDSFGGGIQLSRPVFDRLDEILALAREIVEGCACRSGCPSCVMLGRRPDGNRDLSKAGAREALRSLSRLS